MEQKLRDLRGYVRRFFVVNRFGKFISQFETEGHIFDAIVLDHMCSNYKV